MVRSRIGLAALFLLALSPRAAHADLPPPEGYVEACQVSKVQKKGEFCTICPTTYSDADACARRFHADKLAWEHRCRARGGATWAEIWCTRWSNSTPPQVPPPVPRPKQ